MRACCVVALLFPAAFADMSGCVTDPDVPNSCQKAAPVGDATSLLQQRHLKMAERVPGERAGSINVMMSTKYDTRCMEHNLADDNVFMRGCSGEKNQLWSFKDGLLKTAANDDKCLDWKDDGHCGPSDKCNVFMNSCQNIPSQKWKWDGTYDQKEVLKTDKSNDLVLDYDHESPKKNVRMYRNQVGRGQTWFMTKQAPPCSTGRKVLKSQNDDKCLNVDIDSVKNNDGRDVDVQPCQGKTPQEWLWKSVGPNEYQLRLDDGAWMIRKNNEKSDREGNCLQKDGDHAFTFKCDGGENKVWKYEDGQLKAKWGQFKECLENKHGENGVRVKRCDPSKPASQKWDFAESPQCAVPVDCTLSVWSPWSACSTTCGTGTKTRSRDVKIDAQHGGNCEGALEASEECKEKECPVDCTMSDWSPWGACSTTCGRGKRIRSRTINAQAEHGGTCDNAREASEECKEKECPVDCMMSEWKPWTECSKACGPGTKTRSRDVSVEAQHGGKCEGALEASEDCKEKDCPVDCTLSDWSPWSACSTTCGTGTKTRSRDVKIEAQHGGKCEGALEASDECKEKECPRDCTMSDWSSWGACSTTCGRGKRIRSRTINAQAEHGGTCDNAREASEECKEKECPVDCVMSEWKAWTDCSATCGHATTFRTRAKISDAQHGGAPCGDDKEVNTCPELVCPQEVFTVCGTVKAAQTNDAIEGAVVKIDQPDSTCEKSSDSGKFCCDNVKKGQVTVNAAHPAWTDYKGEFTIVDGSKMQVKMVSEKKLGEWEIVFTWEDKPQDLDTHVRFGSCHLYYDSPKDDKSRPTCKDTETPVTGILDIDNIRKITGNAKDKDMPETTTFKDAHKCEGDSCHVWFSIENFSRCKYFGSKTGDYVADIKDSKAKVEIYGYGHAKTVFMIDQEDGALGDEIPASCRVWYVFHLNLESGQISPCKSADKCKP